MIFQLLYTLIFGIIGTLVSFLPGAGDVPLLLPWGLDPLFGGVSHVFHGAIETLPYLNVILTVTLYGIGFELALMFIKLFLGSRAPGNNV